MDPGLEHQISNIHRVIGFRNRLIHGYAFIADDIVWNTLQNDLPVLRIEVDALLNDLDQRSP